MRKIFFLLAGFAAFSFLYGSNAYAVTVYPGTTIGDAQTNYTADASPNFNVTSINFTDNHIFLGNRYFDLNSSSGQVNANITKFTEDDNMTVHITTGFGNVHWFIYGQATKVKLGSTIEPYGTNWQYVLGNTVTDITVGSNTDVSVSFTNTAFPYVNTLYYTGITTHTIDLSWISPNTSGMTFEGYMINYTTPFGDPMTVIVPDTGTPITTYHVSGLTNSTAYSFRVGTIANGIVWTQFANILNATTLSVNGPCLTAGCINLNVGTNPMRIPFHFIRDDLNSTRLNLYVQYPNTFNTTCNFNYELANTNQSYYNLSTTPNGTGRVYSLFQFSGTGGDIINVICKDVKTNTTGNYVITQTIDKIPIVEQIHAFQSGQFGTAGQFGAFDFILLVIIIISMIALNRVNETVGIVIMLIVIGALAVFHIGSIIVAIVGAMALVALLAVSTTKKLAFSP